MKKYIFIIALALSTLSTFATERVDDVKKVTVEATSHFAQEFAYAEKVSWNIKDLYIQANYSFKGKRMAALYDLQGKYLGAVEYLTYKDLPLKARTKIDEKYANYTFRSALKIVDRPEGANDLGTYLVDVASDSKQLVLAVSESADVSVHKTIWAEKLAKK